MIIVSNLSKTFTNNGKPSKVLDGISFKINKGEIVTLLGKSGCGKSTLLHMVGGFTNAEEGTVFMDKQKVQRPTKKSVMLFQQHNLLPWRSVLKNVGLGLEGENIPQGEKETRIMDALQLVGLERYIHQFPHELSGGMQQRVAIARAFAMQPDVILMDEPFAALDTFNRYHLQDELLRIQAQMKTTILMVTHDIDEAVYLSDRVLIMSSQPGKIFKDIEIPQSKPRNRIHSDFLYYRRKILEQFELSGTNTVPEYTI